MNTISSEWIREEEKEEEEATCLACVACGNEPSILGTLGLRWCAACQYREHFMAWGKAHGWPDLPCVPCTVTAGAGNWAVACAVGQEDALRIALLSMNDLSTCATREEDNKQGRLSEQAPPFQKGGYHA